MPHRFQVHRARGARAARWVRPEYGDAGTAFGTPLSLPASYSEARYLSSKKTVDDRSLNKDVIERLRHELAADGPSPRVLEVGGGLGTMIARLVDWGIVRRASYTLLEMDAALVAGAADWISAWAAARGYAAARGAETLRIRGEAAGAGAPVDVEIRLMEAELGEYLMSRKGEPTFDLLVANALLDLVDVPATLAGLFGPSVLAPRSLYWFSINFDGETIFEPSDPHDDVLLGVYHQTMDERVRLGRPAGDSRTGRHLFAALRAAGAKVLAAGASDWVVHPHAGSYPADEAYFLHHIIHTIEHSLRQRPEVDQAVLASWVARRQSEISRAELVYIAHQLDYVGRGPG